jgi:hypothetical protein
VAPACRLSRSKRLRTALSATGLARATSHRIGTTPTVLANPPAKQRGETRNARPSRAEQTNPATARTYPTSSKSPRNRRTAASRWRRPIAMAAAPLHVAEPEPQHEPVDQPLPARPRRLVEAADRVA